MKIRAREFCLLVVISIFGWLPTVSMAADGYSLGIYKLEMIHNGWMCFDFTAGDLSDSVALRLRPCTGGMNQEWQIERVKTGYPPVRFRNVLNNTCITANPDPDGLPVVQRACTEGVNDYSQHWIDQSEYGIEYDDTPLQFKSRSIGKCMHNIAPLNPPTPYGLVKLAACNNIRKDHGQQVIYDLLRDY